MDPREKESCISTVRLHANYRYMYMYTCMPFLECVHELRTYECNGLEGEAPLISECGVGALDTVLRQRVGHEESEGCESYEEDYISDEVEGVEPQSKLPPLVLQETGHEGVGEQVRPLTLHLRQTNSENG